MTTYTPKTKWPYAPLPLFLHLQAPNHYRYIRPSPEETWRQYNAEFEPYHLETFDSMHPDHFYFQGNNQAVRFAKALFGQRHRR